MASTAKIRSFFLFRWIYDLQLSRKLSLLIWLYLFIIVLVIALSITGIKTMSAIRAYVTAEALWSKAQKEAVLNLYLSARPERDAEGHYDLFLRNLAVAQGDRQAWTEMEKTSPDLRKMEEGFVAGGSSPEDAADMLWFYKSFRSFRYTEGSLEIWRQGDSLLLELIPLAHEIAEERRGSNPDPGRMASLLNRVEKIDNRLTQMEDSFSSNLAEAARWLRQVFSLALFGVSAFLVLLATGLSYAISQRIRVGVMDLKEGAERVGRGDLNGKVVVDSSDELGELAGAFNAMTEALAQAIEEARESQERLRRSEERYRFLVENIPHAIFYKDTDSVYVACNRALAENLGISAPDCAGKTDYDFFPPDLAEKYRKDDRLVMGKGAAIGFDEPSAFRGEERIVHTVKAPIRDDANRIVGILGIFWDITERKRAEESLKQRLMFENTIFAISSRFNLSTDIDASVRSSLAEMGRLCLADRVYLFLFSDNGETMTISHEWCSEGLSSQTQNLRALPSETLPWLMERLRRGEVIHIEDVSALPPEARRERETLDAIGISSLLLCPVSTGSRLLGFIGFNNMKGPRQWRVEDLALLRITSEIIGNALDRQGIQEDLREHALALERSNRELEQFAYVASHDLKEPLRKIMSFTELLEKRYKGQLDEKADRYIYYIVEGTKRMNTLIHDLLIYSRVGRESKGFAPTDCNALLARVLEDLSLVIRESGAKVTSDQLPSVLSDDIQLGQVFQNLISNAIKFHGQEPPRVHVSAVAIPWFLQGGGTQPAEIERHLREARKGWVFSVRDNGIGIDTPYHGQIFLIFQRLHARTEYSGTGIGLAICKKVVEGLGGRIWVESEAGKGATFFFSIPDRG
ncbi:MAG: ATP-binding protein [Thermodesulfovibrionales bacterium]|jgi:PAS domain S-box-containing protein